MSKVSFRQRWQKTSLPNKLMVISSCIMAFATMCLVIAGTLQYLATREQLQAVREQSNIMRGQLESMNSSSKQTQDLIAATKETANASQSVAEQNKELVKHAGEQAKAATSQAAASQTQANAAKQAIGVAQITARAAERNADIAAKSFIGERPVVFFKTVGIKTFEPNKIARIEVKLSNSGRTTAYHIGLETDFTLMVMPFSKALKYAGNGANDVYDITLPPGNEVTLTVWTQFPIEEIQFNAVKSGIIKFYFFGRGQYADEIGKSYPFAFCYDYDPETSTLTICPADVKAQ